MLVGGLCVLAGVRSIFAAVPEGGPTTAGLGMILFGIVLACIGALLRHSSDRNLQQMRKARERSRSNARARQSSEAPEAGPDAYDYRRRGRSAFGQRRTH